MSDEPNKIIYSMIGVSKYYDQKPVLKDISLSYFYGAKIGVLGLNGSGKSSLLRILAGVDPEFHGETHLSPGNFVGLVEPLQNPAGLAQRIDHRVLIGDPWVRQLDSAAFTRADIDGLLAAGHLANHGTVLENDQAHVVLLNSEPPGANPLVCGHGRAARQTERGRPPKGTGTPPSGSSPTRDLSLLLDRQPVRPSFSAGAAVFIAVPAGARRGL